MKKHIVRKNEVGRFKADCDFYVRHDENVRTEGNVLHFPDSTARILILVEYGKIPKKKRLYKKRLKKACHKAMILGIDKGKTLFSDKLRKRYL